MSLLGNANWDRWIFSSMTKYFEAEFGSTYDTFIEGTHRGLPDGTELIEFRLDGPMRRQVSHGYHILLVEINLLLRSFMDDDDFHKMRQLSGDAATWLGQNFCIYRYGDGIDDDDTLLGTLQLRNRKPLENVRINQFGQIEPQYRIEQATVEASFQIHLYEGD